MDLNSNPVWRNLENRLLNVLQEYTDHFLQDPEQGGRVDNNIPIHQRRHFDNEYEMLNDTIYYYSQNMHDYNSNIRDMIHLVENYQASRTLRNIIPPSINLNTNNTRPTPPPFRMYYNTQWIPAEPTLTILSREDISRSTLTYGFTEEMNGQDVTNNVCPISLEPFRVGDVICEIRGCRHKFKRPNLMTWLNRNSNCPVCRYSLTPQDPVSENVTTSDSDQFQNSLSHIFQNLLQGINGTDASANLLYEFELPIYSNPDTEEHDTEAN